MHAAKVDRAFAQKTGTTFDVMTKDDVAVAERAREYWFGRAKHGDNWYIQQRGEMHRSGIVREQQSASLQFLDQLIEVGFANPIDAAIAQNAGDMLSNIGVLPRPEQSPFYVVLNADFLSDFGKSIRQPSFRRSVFGTRTKTER